MWQAALAFLHSDDFYRSLRRVIGIILPLVLFRLLGYPDIGATLMAGALVVMGLDLPVDWKRKAQLIGTAALINTSIILINVLIVDIEWLLAIFLFLVLFSLSFLSLFSAPYTMMTIFATLAILISMGESFNGWADWLVLGGLTVAGAGWYFIYTTVLHYWGHPSAILRQLRWSLEVTADYLDLQLLALEGPQSTPQWLESHLGIRNRIINRKAELEQLIAEELSFIYRFRGNYQAVFNALDLVVRIWDRALGHTHDFEQLRLAQLSESDQQLLRHRQEVLIKSIRRQQHAIHPTGLKWQLVPLPPFLGPLTGMRNTPIVAELSAFQQKTLWCLHALHERLERPPSKAPTEVPLSFQTQLYGPQINWSRIRKAFHWRSRAFRHALRIALVGVSGFFLGQSLSLANPSWILLTAVVILRPDYRSSRQRFYLRIVGTLIGVVIGVGLYQLQPGPYGTIALFAIALQVAFAFLNYNYAVSSALFSVFILFLYAYQQADFLENAYFRIIDTLLGALLAYLAVRYLLPFWEHENLARRVRRNLNGQQELIRQLNLLGQGRMRVEERGYDLAQERAFLRQRELETAVQRMQSEPLPNQALHQNYRAFLLASEKILVLLAALGERLRYYPASQRMHELQSLNQRAAHHLTQMATNWQQPDRLTSLSEEHQVESLVTLATLTPEPLAAPATDHPAFRIYPFLFSGITDYQNVSTNLSIAYQAYLKRVTP